jgi:hypothetical protein
MDEDIDITKNVKPIKIKSLNKIVKPKIIRPKPKIT